MNSKQVLEKIQKENISFIDFWFVDTYAELKYKECNAFAQTPTAWEVSMYADA